MTSESLLLQGQETVDLSLDGREVLAGLGLVGEFAPHFTILTRRLLFSSLSDLSYETVAQTSAGLCPLVPPFGHVDSKADGL
jgi:hypothetical protein